MEPRPQRPRSQPTPQPTEQQPAAQRQQTGRFRPGDFPDSADPGGFVAPLRNDYDYSPLDLAPSGQRRRRQLVAAAVGGLFLLLLGAAGVFGYLAIRDDDNGTDDKLLAQQTQVAQTQVAVQVQQTEVAGGSATETPESDDNATTAPDDEATDEPETTTEPTSESDESTTEPTESADEGAGSGGLSSEQLAELLPPADDAAAGLTETTDTNLELAGVVEALGGSRTAQTNLEQWGWSGNAARQYDPVDAEAVAAGDVSYMNLSIHSFADAASAGEALPFFSNILANGGYEEVEEVPELGDSARMLTTVDENGQTVIALYVQQGSLLYRVSGGAIDGDPTEAVANLMEAALANGEAAFNFEPVAVARLEWVR